MISSTSCLFPPLPSSAEALIVFHCITTETWWLASLFSPFSLSKCILPWMYQTYFSKTQIRTGYPFLYLLKNFLRFPLSPRLFFLTEWPPPLFYHHFLPDPTYMQHEANLAVCTSTAHSIREMWEK